jgi:hypothetical protein
MDPTLTDQIDTGTDPGSTDTGVALVSSTGANDPNSLWYTGLLQGIFNTATATATQYGDQQLNQLLGTQTPEQASGTGPGAAISPAATSGTRASAAMGSGSAGSNKTLLYVVAGLAVVVLGYFLLKGK